jgi:NAD(P)-dependent dehydrogenase (short-subunit alcohol dehydrogenase family)
MSEEKKIANKGIGFEIARQLGVQNIAILVGARDQARGEAAMQKLRAEKIEAVVVQLDVTNQASIDAVAAFIDQTYGRLDILVNNAGISVREYVVPAARPARNAILPGDTPNDIASAAHALYEYPYACPDVF